MVREVPPIAIGAFGVCYLSGAVVIVIVVTTDNVPARLKG